MKEKGFLESLFNLLLPLGLIFGLVLLLSLNVRETPIDSVATPLESWLKVIVGYLAAGAEIAAALVIGAAVIRGIFEYLGVFFSRSRPRFDVT